MHLEKERKYLLRALPQETPDNILSIFQFYTDECRYREQTEKNGSITKFFKTKKKYISPGVNEEIENEVDSTEFQNNLPSAKKLLKKTRYIYYFNNLKFEVDIFDDYSFVLLEVEVDDMDKAISFPSFLKALIHKQVTGNTKFNNYTLALAPDKPNAHFKKSVTRSPRSYTVYETDPAFILLSKTLKERTNFNFCKTYDLEFIQTKNIIKLTGLSAAEISYVRNRKRSITWNAFETLANVLNINLTEHNIKKEDFTRSKERIQARNNYSHKKNKEDHGTFGKERQETDCIGQAATAAA